jgi:hypothetical protein
MPLTASSSYRACSLTKWSWQACIEAVVDGESSAASAARRFAIIVVKSSLSLRRKASNARPTPTLKSSKVNFSGASDEPRTRSSCSHLPADHAASAAKGRILLDKVLEALNRST